MAFDEKKTTRHGGGICIPHFSETCGVEGCENDTEVVVLLMRDHAGRQKAAEQPHWYIKRQGDDWYMKEGWNFDAWVTRCGGCYRKDYEIYTGRKTLSEKLSSKPVD